MRKQNIQPFSIFFQIVALALCLCASLGAAHAASLGKMNVLSKLGAPLVAEIEVLNLTADEEGALSAKIASAETFKLAGVDFNPALSAVRATLSKEGGKTKLILNSSTAVAEPLLDVLVELNWATGRLVREYTVLLDPTEIPEKVQAPLATPAAKEPLANISPAVSTVASPDTKLLNPANPANSAASAAPAPNAEKSAAYTIRAGDTLYALAAKLSAGKPSELSTVLASIYQNNPDAFISGDANRMKAGSVIQLPSGTALSTQASDAPAKTVNLSTSNFNAYRQKVAKASKQAPKTQTKKSRKKQGKVTAKVSEAVLPDAAKDQLKVAGTAQVQAQNAGAQASNTTAPATKKQVKPAAEDQVAKERALAEEAARKAILEKSNADLKKALAIKNDKLAAMTAAPPVAAPAAPVALPAPAAKPAAPAPAIAPLPVAVPAAPVSPVAPLPPPATATPAPAAMPVPAPAATPVAPAISAPVPALQPAPAAPAVAPPTELQAPPKPVNKPALKPMPTPVVESAWHENLDPLMLGGLGAVLAMGGGLVLMRNRKKNADGEFSDSVIQADGAPNSLLDADGGHAVDTQHSAFASNFSPANAGIDAAEVDPIAEADVYMQYGREAHAIEILKDALSHDTNNKQVRLKLMEVYAKVQNLGEVEAQCRELQRTTAGKGPDWEAAQAIGRAADVNNPLYGAVSKQGAPSFTRSASTPVAGVTRALPASLSGVDFTTPTAIGDVPVKQPPAAAVKAQAALGSDGSGLNFATTLPTVDFKPKAKAAGDVPSALNVSLDFDVSAPAGVTPTRMAISEPAKIDTPPSSIDFKLSSFDMAGVPKLPPSPAPSPMGAMPPAAGLAKPSTNLAGTDFGKSLNSEQEFNTKLNLAEAYAEIGDKDGAKELLNEVIAAGDGAASAQAKAMLAKL